MTRKMTDLIRGNGNSKRELPKRFPGITDWVIYWWGDASMSSPAIPMQLKVTSGIPTTGQISGIAFFDPGTPLTDAKGTPLQVPPLMPVALADYSSAGRKLSWMTIPEFQQFVKKAIKEAEAGARSQSSPEVTEPTVVEPEIVEHAYDTPVINMKSLRSDDKESASGIVIPPADSSR